MVVLYYPVVHHEILQNIMSAVTMTGDASTFKEKHYDHDRQHQSLIARIMQDVEAGGGRAKQGYYAVYM